MTIAARIALEDPKRAAIRRLVPYVFVALWCAGFSFIKVGLVHAEPMTYLALRHGLCLLVFASLAVAIRPTLPASAAAWAHLVVVGVVIQFGYFALCYVAVEHGVSAGGLALIASLQPILVGLLAPGLVGERVTVRRWLGLVLGLGGAALVITSRGALGAGSLVGLLGAVGALLAITSGTLYEKRFGTGEHVVTANLVQYAAGLAVSAPLAFGFETMRVDWTPDFITALAYLVVASSLISTTLLLLMVRHGEVSRVSAIFFLVPPSAALAAWLIAGETMPPVAWGGMALAAVGVAVATRRAAGRRG
jgi:drug/metabolite transporter (DMT)-like permease